MRQKKLQIFLMNLLLDVYICLVSQEEECTSSFWGLSQMYTSGIIEHSNEMPISLLILCWWYFIYLQMYLDKFFKTSFQLLSCFFKYSEAATGGIL